MNIVKVVSSIIRSFSTTRMSLRNFRRKSDLKKVNIYRFPQGLTFYKDYSGSGLDADYSLGVQKCTFTASRSATNPATYIDSNGVIQLVTTSNIPRFDSGYYDSTGFNTVDINGIRIRGRVVEGAGTNLIIRTDGTASGSGLWTGWSSSDAGLNGTSTKSQVAIPELTGIVGANAQRIQYTGVGADVDETAANMFSSTNSGVATVVSGNVVTLSFYYKAANVGCNFHVDLVYKDNTGTLISASSTSNLSNSSSWLKITVTGTAPALTDRVNVKIIPTNIDNGDVLDFQFAMPQVEINPYATSFIPTTTAALTRNAEVGKYAILGNRTAAQETIVAKFVPFSNFANDGVARRILDTETSRLQFAKTTTGTVVRFDENGSRSATGTTTLLANTSYVVAGALQSTGNPNKQNYLNGVSEGTENTDISLTHGTYFFIGSDVASGTHLNGLIQSIAIFNRALSQSEITVVTNLLNAQ